MTPFRFEHEFRGNKRRYWELFFDENATREQLQAGGMKSFEIDEINRDGAVWRRVLRATPARDLPLLVRKVTGASLSYCEESVFYEDREMAVTTVVPTTLGGRITFRGEHHLQGSKEGHFVRTFEGSLDVRIAIVGKKIETIILAEMDKSYRLGAELTQRGLLATTQPS